jgi:hypothetical protein
MVRPASELAEVTLEVFPAHMDMGQGDGLLELPSERLDMVGVVRGIMPVVIISHCCPVN